jgi:exodeoxyribonuclease V gamma subunit
MIYLKKAYNLTSLAKKIAQDLKVNRQGKDPFEQDWIIVQNKETQAWLTSTISRTNGISANIKFIYPSELAWQIVRLNQPEIPIQLPTDRIAIQARLFDLITIEKHVLSEIGLNVPDESKLILSLTDSISDVFDLYQVFRPHMLQNWKHNVDARSEVTHWQSYLWNKVSNEIALEFPEIPSRSELFGLIKDLMVTNNEKLPRTISIFGLSHWSKVFHDFIDLVSMELDIFWYDQELSVTGLEMPKLDEWSNPKIQVQRFFNTDSANTHLESLFEESDVTNLARTKVHSCHNAEREVQVLKNELLSYLDNNPSTSIDDVLIMVPDFEKYSLIIQNEFDPKGDYPKIPVYVPKMERDASSQYLIDQLSFFISGEKVTQFIELINHSVVKDRFEISETEIKTYTKAFHEMNIHYGLTTSDSSFSIEKGVNQLLLSYSMLAGNYQSFAGYSIESYRVTSDSKDNFTKLSSFFRRLKDIKSDLDQEYSLLGWIELIECHLQSLLNEGDSLFRLIEKIRKQLQYSKSVSLLSFEGFYNWFIQQITDQSASSTRPGTGIRISSYIPYRNIPFKFVAILGLNEGVFPRNVYRPDFDLIHKNPLPGDRISKNDDSLLFMERVLSTKEQLHLSYIGEGEQGKMPSPLIQEFMDSLNIQPLRHALHSFSSRHQSQTLNYPSIETGLTTYLTDSEASKIDRFEGKVDLENNKEIELNDLTLFFTNPSKQLLDNVIGVKNIFDESQPEDREKYMLDGLDKFHLKRDLIDYYNDFDSIDTFRSYALLRGDIPRGSVGNRLLNEHNKMVTLISSEIAEINRKDELTQDVRFEVNGKILVGSISSIYEKERIIWKVSAIKPKDLIDLWIKHLVLCNVDTSHSKSVLIGIDKNNEIERVSFGFVSNAQTILSDLLNIYQSPNSTKDHWSCIPTLSHEYVRFRGDPEKQLIKVENAWFSDSYSYKEDSDFFNQTIWKSSLPWKSDFFQKNSSVIWEPIFEHLEDDENE